MRSVQFFLPLPIFCTDEEAEAAQDGADKALARSTTPLMYGKELKRKTNSWPGGSARGAASPGFLMHGWADARIRHKTGIKN